MFNLNFIIWTILFLITFKIRKDERGKRGTVEKVKTIIIIIIIFYIMYIFIGIITGFKSSPYSLKISQIAKNFFFIFFLRIEQEFIRNKILKFSDNIWYYVTVVLVFAAVNIDYNIFKQSVINIDQLIEFILSRCISCNYRISTTNVFVFKWRIFIRFCIYNTKKSCFYLNSNFSWYWLVFWCCIRICIIANNIFICKLWNINESKKEE